MKQLYFNAGCRVKRGRWNVKSTNSN